MIDMKRPIQTLKEEMAQIQRGASLPSGELRDRMLESVEAHRRAISLLEAEDAIYEDEDPLATILRDYAGLEGLGHTGRVVRELVAEVRSARRERDELRKVLERKRAAGADPSPPLRPIRKGTT